MNSTFADLKAPLVGGGIASRAWAKNGGGAIVNSLGSSNARALGCSQIGQS
jgi:hypothetical protein